MTLPSALKLHEKETITNWQVIHVHYYVPLVDGCPFLEGVSLCSSGLYPLRPSQVHQVHLSLKFPVPLPLPSLLDRQHEDTVRPVYTCREIEVL